MPVSAKEYYEGILKQAGVSDAKRQALITALEDDEVSKALANEQVVPRMRHDEFSREMDKVRKDKEEYYARMLQWKNEQDALYAQTTQTVQPPVNPDYMTKKDLEALEKKYQAELERQSNIQVDLLGIGMELASDYAVTYKKRLDTNALKQIAIEKKLSLRDAYAEMTRADRETQQAAQRKAEIDQARADAVREFASTHQIPIDSTPREAGYGRATFDGQSKAVADYDSLKQQGRLSNQQNVNLRNAFVEEWNKSDAGSTQ